VPDLLVATVTGQARATLTADLVVACDPWPVFAHRPAEPVAPMVFLDVVGRRADADAEAPVVVVTFPVVAVVDGADPAQLDLLDSIGDRIWHTAEGLDGFPSRADPGFVDVGGPTLRQLVTYVDVYVSRHTLCPSEVTPP
jgi:hypothetical protein